MDKSRLKVRTQFMRELSLARKLWPNQIHHLQTKSLRALCDQYDLKVATGDVLLLEGRWYVTHAGLSELPPAEASLATTWLKGRRQYRNEPLRYVLADIDRYTGKQIAIVNTAVGDLQFTGTLDLDNSDAWLKGLAVALPVTIGKSQDGQMVIAARE